jgi:type IV pilus assembly protein PilM
MNLTKIFQKDYIIGLDIGSSSIKLVQFMKKPTGLYFIKADLREYQEGKEIVPVLKDLFKEVDLKESQVMVTVNCPKTALKMVKAPYMPKSELRDGIRLEAKNYFPFKIEDSALDYEIAGTVTDKGVRKYEILVAATPVSTVDKYLALLTQAGIKPVSFVPAPYAMQKLAESLYGSVQKDATAVLVIGRFHAELVILKGKKLVFSHKMPVTGENFTKALTGVLTSDRGKTELSLAEAEKIKRQTGIPSGTGSEIIAGKISTGQILSMLRAPLEELVAEIEKCFRYYREESAGGTIKTLTLFGGGASLEGFIKYLSGELDIEVRLGNVWESFKAGSIARQGNEPSYRFALATGAALTEGKGINLLPPEIKEETKRVVQRSALEAVATTVILILILLYIGMRIQLGNFENRIRVARLELSSLQLQFKEAEAYRLADAVLIDEPHWEDTFKELSNLIPDGVYLTSMSMRNKLITMKGIVESEDGEEILSDFILTLARGIFRNVKLVSTKDLKHATGNEFELQCWID